MGELGEAEFAHPLFRLIALVVSDEKLRTAGSAALRVLTVARRFRNGDTARAKDFARRRSDAPAPGKVARVVVGCRQGRGLKGKPGELFRDEFRMVHHLDVELSVSRDLSIVFIQHRGAVGAAGNDLLYLGILKGINKFLRKLQEKVFVARASRRLATTGFAGKNAHKGGLCLPC